CAAAGLLIFTRNLGLFGTINIRAKNRIAGISSAQNIQRQPVCPFHEFKMASGVLPLGIASAIRKLATWAARIPITKVNWLMDTNRPLYFAGAISAIYIGDRVEARPIPNPPMTLSTINNVKLSA